MSKRHPLALAVLLVSAVLIAAIPLAVLGQSATPVTPIRLAAGGFGPQLLFLDPAPTQTGTMRGLGVAVHTTVSGARAIASAAAGACDMLRAGAISCHILDPDTRDKVYYFVEASEADVRDLAAGFGAIIYDDGIELLLAVPITAEPAFVATLPTRGVHIALLSSTSLSLAPQPSPAPVRGQAATADPAIAALLPQVTEVGLRDLVAGLSGEQPVLVGGATTTFYTRYTFAAPLRDVERYLYERYVELDLAPSYVAWTYGGYNGRNVVADIPGTVHPEWIWLIGGHFDSISDVPYSSAPGADDNASSTAATLLIAAALAGHRFTDTIRFVHFSGEEQGMWGSQAYAQVLAYAGAQVMGYLDLDMIGYDSDGDRTMEVHAGTRPNSVSLASAFVAANTNYSQGLRVELKTDTAVRYSDHSSFWDYGYAAFAAIENYADDAIPRDRNPWYHTTEDRLAHVNLNYLARTARTALAAVAELAVMGADPTATPTVTATVTATTAPPTVTATATATTAPPTVTATATATTATPTVTATATATATPIPFACTEQVANGGFETTGSWAFAVTATQGGYTTAQVHRGMRSARLGIAPETRFLWPVGQDGSNTCETNLLGEIAPFGGSYSTAYQTVSIPMTANTATLTFWRWSGAEAVSGADFQRVLLLNADYTYRATLLQVLENVAAWRPATFDLTSYRGQTFVIYFEVYNDDTGAGPRTWMYLDDVSLLACARPMPAPPRVWLPLIQCR